jgi:flagellar motor switch protein FliG
VTEDATHTSETAASDPVAKAVAMLQMLAPEVRESVLGKMAPELRERVETRLNSMPEGSSPDIAAQRRLLRETAQRLADRRLKEAEETADSLDPVSKRKADNERVHGVVPEAINQDPLDKLRNVHPAALARAMQGERAEAWALVLDHVNDNVRIALQQYLDTAAREAIETARTKQEGLAQQLRETIERAIARTVVPRALREQRLLFSPYAAGGR